MAYYEICNSYCHRVFGGIPNCTCNCCVKIRDRESDLENKNNADCMKEISELKANLAAHQERIEVLEKGMQDLDKVFLCLKRSFEEMLSKPKNRIPHKCPLCEGSGTVNADYNIYDAEDCPVPCKACEGTGIVWG